MRDILQHNVVVYGDAVPERDTPPRHGVTGAIHESPKCDGARDAPAKLLEGDDRVSARSVQLQVRRFLGHSVVGRWAHAPHKWGHLDRVRSVVDGRNHDGRNHDGESGWG